MSIAKWFGFGGDSKSAAGVIDALANAGDRLFTSDEERAKWEATKETIRQQPMMAQAIITLVSAQSASPFVAGARAAVVYALAGMLAYTVIVRDILILCLGVSPEKVPAAAIPVDSVLKFIGTLFGAL